MAESIVPFSTSCDLCQEEWTRYAYVMAKRMDNATQKEAAAILRRIAEALPISPTMRAYLHGAPML